MTIRLIFSLLIAIHASVLSAETLQVPGGTFDVQWQDQFGHSEKQRIRDWLTHTAESTSLINGKFPISRTQILIHKIRRGKGPVPWAHTMRAGNPEGVTFHVNPRKSLKEFKRDWTATHEFSHLYLPYIGRDDIWLSEGFASYYQHILMMRKGTLTEKQGWLKIKAGLDRGAADPYQTGSLKHASENMRTTRAFKRVYWSGALYFMELDIQLRSQGSSLDQVITEFQLCCRNKSLKWDGPRLVEQLDLVSHSMLFSQKFREFQQLQGFPDFRDTLANLGIEYRGRKIKLAGNAQQQSLRGGISRSTNPSIPLN